MLRIVLATLNARYSHASFGLRYLLANLGPHRQLATLREFTIEQQPLTIVEQLLAEAQPGEPLLIGFGVYIWNITETTEVIALLRTIRPDLRIVIGGPEVSFEYEGTEIFRLCDHLVIGEGDVAFRELVEDLLAGKTREKVVRAALPDIAALRLPYDEYTDTDLRERMIYVEASRGCPFTCEFCLSSLDIPVRAFPLEAFLGSMQRLMDRGATQFKFVDRTFNLHLPTSTAILQFFLDRWREGLFLHFEMVPDRLPEQLRGLIRQFPPGAVQFEVGIQTFDDATSKNISRRQNLDRLADNFRFLREETGVHIHADLIVGLPGEDIESFGRGFDRLVRLGPQEIQVGILKRLRGTPIVRHDHEHGMLYAPHPPYEILATRAIPFEQMQRMRRFARYWDLVANSGHFTGTLKLMWQNAESPFAQFLHFSDWLHAKLARTHQIALHVLAQALFEFLVKECALDSDLAASTLEADWHRTPSREALNLRGHHLNAKPAEKRGNQRQSRHTHEAGARSV